MENIITKELEDKIKNAENLDELVAVCVEAGLEVTKEQLENELNKQETGELDEGMLENVSGGVAPVLLGPVIVGIWIVSKIRRK